MQQCKEAKRNSTAAARNQNSHTEFKASHDTVEHQAVVLLHKLS
jgi:hypothetical protein